MKVLDRLFMVATPLFALVEVRPRLEGFDTRKLFLQGQVPVDRTVQAIEALWTNAP